MTAKATITSKFQVTIPKIVRETLGFRDGDEIIFIVRDGGEVIMKKMDKQEKNWLTLAESSFSEWDNPEDSVYDKL